MVLHGFLRRITSNLSLSSSSLFLLFLLSNRRFLFSGGRNVVRFDVKLSPNYIKSCANNEPTVRNTINTAFVFAQQYRTILECLNIGMFVTGGNKFSCCQLTDETQVQLSIGYPSVHVTSISSSY